jgi:hypothetical protein
VGYSVCDVNVKPEIILDLLTEGNHNTILQRSLQLPPVSHDEIVGVLVLGRREEPRVVLEGCYEVLEFVPPFRYLKNLDGSRIEGYTSIYGNIGRRIEVSGISKTLMGVESRVIRPYMVIMGGGLRYLKNLGEISVVQLPAPVHEAAVACLVELFLEDAQLFELPRLAAEVFELRVLEDRVEPRHVHRNLEDHDTLRGHSPLEDTMDQGHGRKAVKGGRVVHLGALLKAVLGSLRYILYLTRSVAEEVRQGLADHEAFSVEGELYSLDHLRALGEAYDVGHPDRNIRVG